MSEAKPGNDMAAKRTEKPEAEYKAPGGGGDSGTLAGSEREAAGLRLPRRMVCPARKGETGLGDLLRCLRAGAGQGPADHVCV